MLSYERAITAAIMELKNQTRLSASDIKKNMTGSSANNIRKTILTMKELPERKWMNAMFLVNLNRMVANGTLIKVKDTYTLIEAETIKHTTEAENETVETAGEPRVAPGPRISY